MRTVNIHEAKTQLSKLVEAAAQGEPFIIAKAGKPMVRVQALDAPHEPDPKDRLGFMEGYGVVPDNIKAPFQNDIDALFYGNPDKFNEAPDSDDNPS